MPEDWFIPADPVHMSGKPVFIAGKHRFNVEEPIQWAMGSTPTLFHLNGTEP